MEMIKDLGLGFFHLSLIRFVPVEGQMYGWFSGAIDLVSCSLTSFSPIAVIKESRSISSLFSIGY